MHTFDLIDHHMIFFFLDSVRTTFHQDVKIFIAKAVTERHFRLVSCSHLSLDLFMDPGSLRQ